MVLIAGFCVFRYFGVDIPFAVSPVVAGLLYLLLYSGQILFGDRDVTRVTAQAQSRTASIGHS